MLAPPVQACTQPRGELERPSEVRLHLHGITAEKVPAILERRQGPISPPVPWSAYAPGMNAGLTAAAIGVGGSVLIALAGFWANVRNTNKITALTEQGQVTDRYTKAIDQLGSDKLVPRPGTLFV